MLVFFLFVYRCVCVFYVQKPYKSEYTQTHTHTRTHTYTHTLTYTITRSNKVYKNEILLDFLKKGQDATRDQTQTPRAGPKTHPIDPSPNRYQTSTTNTLHDIFDENVRYRCKGCF